jgi:capsular exopolysaccharide synthesis family protein
VNTPLPPEGLDEEPSPRGERATGAAGGASLPPELEDARGDLRARLLTYLGLAIKHKVLAAAIVGVFLFGGLVVTVRTPKIYSAATTIKIDRSVPRVVKGSLAQSDADNGDAQFYDTQYELIRSRTLADRVATALSLAQSDFLGAPQPMLFDRLLGQDSGPVVIDADAIRARHERAVGQIMAGLSVQPVGQSSVVRIIYAGASAGWAQRISIGVAEQFEKMTLDMRFSASTYARDFLDERLRELKLKLEASEKQLIQYAQKEGIVDVDNRQPQILAEIQDVQTAYANAVTARLLSEETWRQAQADGGSSLPQVMGDSLVQSARARLAQLRASYQDRLTILKPAYPEMIALQSQIDATQKDMRAQIGLIKDSINSQHQAAVANEKALGDELGRLKASALELRGRSVDYTILSREVDTNRSLYDGILQQFRELGVASDAQSNNVSVLDRALLPGEPDSPSLSNNLMIALVFGLAIAAGVIGLIEILDDTFKTIEDMEARLGLPVLGVIPMYRDPDKQRSAISEIVDDPTSPLAESFRSLRTAIQFSTSDGPPRSLLITSSRPGEGKSTTAISVAINFGQLGMRVLLIDGDLRNPSLHRLLDMDNSVGLSNYLSGFMTSTPPRSLLGDSPSGLIKRTPMPGVAVMTSGPPPPNPAELLAGQKLGVLLETSDEFFDIVIIDGPPIMGLADAPILGSAADGAMLVVEGARTRRGVVRDALKRLHFARARVVGGVLNKYHPKHSTGAYGYGYGYGYGWGYGYGAGAEKYVYRKKPGAALEGAHGEA